MATTNQPASEAFETLANSLIENGVVTITAIESSLLSDQLILSLHPAMDADHDAIRATLEGVETVRIEDRVFTLFCDIDPYGPSTLGRVTVFFDPPKNVHTTSIPPVTLEDGIERLLRIAEGSE